jgi:predicted flap endonuclease-1-like 5' DNA nuclease
MRSDYLLYLLAVVFFLIAATSMALVADQTQKTLWVTSAVILGLVSVGLGYYQKPKPRIAPAAPPEAQPSEFIDPHVRESHLAESVEKHVEPMGEPVSTTPVPMQQVTPIPVLAPVPTPTTLPAPVERAAPVTVEASAPSESELMTVKGINGKRAAQLKALGIDGIDALAKASAEDLAKNLMLSPKITRMWIGSAKKLLKQTE